MVQLTSLVSFPSLEAVVIHDSALYAHRARSYVMQYLLHIRKTSLTCTAPESRVRLIQSGILEFASSLGRLPDEFDDMPEFANEPEDDNTNITNTADAADAISGGEFPVHALPSGTQKIKMNPATTTTPLQERHGSSLW